MSQSFIKWKTKLTDSEILNILYDVLDLDRIDEALETAFLNDKKGEQ